MCTDTAQRAQGIPRNITSATRKMRLSELEKQKLLSEKLENDLLSMNSNNKKINGDGVHMSTEDVLTGLGLSPKPTVSLLTMVSGALTRS